MGFGKGQVLYYAIKADYDALMEITIHDLRFMKKRIILKIHGEVQGVFFRVQAKKRADELGLVGWVRNEPDGTVRIVAENGEDELKKLIEWCYNIPSARVEKIDVERGKATGEFEEFAIKY